MVRGVPKLEPDYWCVEPYPGFGWLRFPRYLGAGVGLLLGLAWAQCILGLVLIHWQVVPCPGTSVCRILGVPELWLTGAQGLFLMLLIVGSVISHS